MAPREVPVSRPAVPMAAAIASLAAPWIPTLTYLTFSEIAKSPLTAV